MSNDQHSRRDILRLARAGTLLATGLGVTTYAFGQTKEQQGVLAKLPKGSRYVAKIYKVEGEKMSLVSTYATVSELAEQIRASTECHVTWKIPDQPQNSRRIPTTFQKIDIMEK